MFKMTNKSCQFMEKTFLIHHKTLFIFIIIKTFQKSNKSNTKQFHYKIFKYLDINNRTNIMFISFGIF